MCIKSERVPGEVFDTTTVNVLTAGFSNIFYEDPSCIKWTNCTAHGSEVFGIPTGFEWHLISLEWLLFSLVFRFSESVFFGASCTCDHTCKKRVMLRRRPFWPKKNLQKNTAYTKYYIVHALSLKMARCFASLFSRHISQTFHNQRFKI